MSRIDLADDARLRSFYLEQAPVDVRHSLKWLHRQADLSPDLRDKRHTDRVLTYLAEVMRIAQERQVAVEMAGLGEADDATEYVKECDTCGEELVTDDPAILRHEGCDS